ncbi:MAG: histidine--tRNA ligase [Nanoarchaeota archaeon]|nr:histidine--tRNA ligase [Nanoarchaeota archaeon]
MELDTAKGTRDIFPEDKIVRDKVVAILKEIFELYGFNPLETPALENYETLSSKYAGGSEIMKEVYTLEDNASRKLGLRYDLTVPFARVIAMNPSMKKPFKRYQIDKVWRDGPIKLGRYREFWQCDVDVVGIKSVAADAEFLALASAFFKKLELDVTIYVNNRKLLNSLLEFSGVPSEKQEEAILSLDKLKKIGIDGVRKELEEKEVPDESIAKIISLFDYNSSSNNETLERVGSFLENKEGLNEMKELLERAEEFGVKNVKLDISLARGLAYYTGTVLEVFLNDNSIASALGAGGRYDKMIGNFVGSSEDIPAVGMSFGLDVISDVIKLKSKGAQKNSVVEVYIIPLGTLPDCIKIASELRSKGINTDLDYSGRSITKNLNYCNGLNIPYVLIIGEDELKKGQSKLKNMITGEEKFINVEKIIDEVRK